MVGSGNMTRGLGREQPGAAHPIRQGPRGNPRTESYLPATRPLCKYLGHTHPCSASHSTHTGATSCSE